MKRVAFPLFAQLPVEEARRVGLQEQIIPTLEDRPGSWGDGGADWLQHWEAYRSEKKIETLSHH